MLTIKHTESERNGIFEAWLDDVQVGELTYQRPTPERMIINHTRVFEHHLPCLFLCTQRPHAHK